MSGLSIVPFQGSGAITKRKNNTSSAVDNMNEMSKSINFSFCRYGHVEEAKEEEPRATPRKSKFPEKENKKSPTKSVRFNNNNLTDISGLKETLFAHNVEPLKVQWLDLSFNELTIIDPVLLDLENLQILYLHGNQIKDLKEIEKLQRLKNLRRLTLHGNPVEKEKNYKQYVVSMFPNLLKLDFSSITKADTRTAETWNKIQNKSPKKPKAKDDED
ncbi:leucine-rich repeat-containing protein 51-like [Ylistrum balloti]|uniref:leucine-rich repeat-containing protein 51-like n=1 Tax=Ylistrum balloti TaxID=509963 RepID=UPI002905DF03|nr:leucine-rich repeat-containing protein 51-like [Ylistrum balloti]